MTAVHRATRATGDPRPQLRCRATLTSRCDRCGHTIRPGDPIAIPVNDGRPLCRACALGACP